MTYYTTLISVTELMALTRNDANVMLFDCSFDLSQPQAGYESYLAQHITGAIYANLDTDLSDKTGHGSAVSGGRHPLPSRERLAAWLSRLGLTPSTQVVVYDRQGSMVAGRLWWMLKWLGHERVALLDGGFQKWQAAQGATRQGSEPTGPASEYPCGTAACSLAQLVDAQEVAKHIGSQNAAIVDARAAPRFKGEVEPLDPIAGHIPGALNRPFNSNLSSEGTFKPAHVLKAEFDALLAGRDPLQTIHHCGSGVSAIPNVLAMAVAGYGMTQLYAGSWSDWCSEPGRPVAQG